MTANQHRVILAEPQEIPLVIQTIQEGGVAGGWQGLKVKGHAEAPLDLSQLTSTTVYSLGTRNMTRNKSRLVPL
jgi:hypothetical protein